MGMAGARVRIQIVIDQELLAQVDRVAMGRRCSQFVEEAIREKLARQVLSDALTATAGILSESDYPEWASPEQISAWVRSIRQADVE
jgi:hypothetical protein